MLLAVCVLLSVFSLSGGLEAEIVGGYEVRPHSRPHMASLQRNGHHTCGGMLIKDNYVLTSAHCSDIKCIYSKVSLKVVLGAHNISKRENSQQVIHVEKYIKHPKYDIMLLKLKTKARRNEFVDVIQLPEINEEILAHMNCTVTGWGMIKPGGSASNILREVTLKLQFSFECKNKWREYFNSEKMICTVAGGKKAFCQGDSGGPLVCESKLLGIATYTYRNDCTRKNFPEIYMKIPAFLTWIKKNIK